MLNYLLLKYLYYPMKLWFNKTALCHHLDPLIWWNSQFIIILLFNGGATLTQWNVNSKPCIQIAASVFTNLTRNNYFVLFFIQEYLAIVYKIGVLVIIFNTLLWVFSFYNSNTITYTDWGSFQSRWGLYYFYTEIC